LGVLLNGLATVPFLSIQAKGRADVTAIANAIELPLFICAIYLMTREWGVTGAASAWTLRVGVDLFALAWMSARMQGRVYSSGERLLVVTVTALTGAAFTLAFIEPSTLRVAGSACAGCAAMALLGYAYRDRLRRGVARILRRQSDPV
jgi:O-antigen/teichoic acid export membrane protein